MDIREFLEKYGKGVRQGTRANQYGSNPITYTFSKNDIDKFNTIYRELLKSDLNQLERTPGGSIKRCVSNHYSWDCIDSKTGVRITVCIDGYIFVFRVGSPKLKDNGMRGWKAWKIFTKLCSEQNIDIDQYAIENGEEVKKSIDSPKIKMLIKDEVLENVHHIDFHNSYPAGLCNTHPEFRKVIEPLYKGRSVHPENKDILNCVIGYMQSISKCKARWAHLSKDAIHDNTIRIMALSFELQGKGNKIIGYNTDGIWYQGKIYHGKGEGAGLGEWHNDHVNCTFRAKSDGAYEFIENGIYHPVIRGFTNLDSIKPREQWKWGDIYQENAEILKYRFKEGEGIVKDE